MLALLACLSIACLIGYMLLAYIQCPHSEEEDSVAKSCGFGDEFHELKVSTHKSRGSVLVPRLFFTNLHASFLA